MIAATAAAGGNGDWWSGCVPGAGKASPRRGKGGYCLPQSVQGLVWEVFNQVCFLVAAAIWAPLLVAVTFCTVIITQVSRRMGAASPPQTTKNRCSEATVL
jgi:hypothetical protein